MTRPVTALAAAALTTLLAACGTATADTQQPAADASAPAGPEGTTLVIGSVSDDPEEEAEVFQPFIDHVADQLGDAGVDGGDVVVAESVEEMAELLRTGAVDLYVDNMNGVTQVVQDGTATPLLRRWKDGAPTYHSVVVARRDRASPRRSSWSAARSPSRTRPRPTATSCRSARCGSSA